MKPFSLFLSIVLVFTTLSCDKTKEKEKTNTSTKIAQQNNSTIIGVWKHMSAQGPVKIHFKENGIIETDLGDDNTIDIISNYSIKSDTIEFFDKEGKSCPNKGIYKIYNRGYTVAFDVIDDLCNGRIKATSGFWVRSNHQEQIKQLNLLIEQTDDEKYILHRGRMHLALGQSNIAKNDFDLFIERDSTDAKVYINRAATRFPNDLKGVLFDCTKAIALDSTDKNAYFLRGLAHYALNEKQKGCDDFKKAIDLGFEILQEAEAYKCNDYW
jgi:hypothetical protein